MRMKVNPVFTAEEIDQATSELLAAINSLDAPQFAINIVERNVQQGMAVRKKVYTALGLCQASEKCIGFYRKQSVVESVE